MKLVQNRDEIYWTPNTITSNVNINSKIAHIELTSETPNLKEYQMKESSSRGWQKTGINFDLKLKKSRYEFTFRVVNLVGVSGPEHRIIINNK
jgi:hypothetical protein